jgi:PleD family two-component response regulator
MIPGLAAAGETSLIASYSTMRCNTTSGVLARTSGESTRREPMAANQSARVLIVDDDEAICWVVHDVLEEAGYIVSEAPDGRSALDQLLASPHRNGGR